MPDSDLPVLDLTPLRHGNDAAAIRRLAADMGKACRETGFFQVIGHGVPADLQKRLESSCRTFFAQPTEQKLRIRMELGGKAWRGYFPLGSELTSGEPDRKEGLYFGAELPDEHPLVAAGTPLHGRNLFPEIPGFRRTVLEYLDAMTDVGQLAMKGIALSLGLPPAYFEERYTRDPIVLFRVFHYPPCPGSGRPVWGVGEHTDYGLLTILLQDDTPGLQVRCGARWIDVPPTPGALVCNLGDMLDRMTGGLYRSTPHRVRNETQQGRLSFPFFFDPGWEARIEPIRFAAEPRGDLEARWDHADLQELRGTYGEYLLRKVSRVFPDLGRGAFGVGP